jgi:RND family efflux transporter MFP subunit
MNQRTLISAAASYVVAGVLFLSSPVVTHGQDAATPDKSSSPSSTSTVTGITAPSEKLKLATATPGIVLERKVKPGDKVSKDQVLLQLDDRYEVKALDAVMREAANTSQIDAAVADLDLRKVQLARKERMLLDKVAGLSEVEEARLQVKIGDIREKLQREELAIKGIERDRQKLKVDQMILKSPIDGEVLSIDVGPGEWADPQKPTGLVTVLKNDPLWVEVHLPSSQSQKLDKNASLLVKHDKDDQGTTAKIIFMAPEVDAASDTQLVRLELPNPKNRRSGLQVTVVLPENVAAVAQGR